MRHFALYISLLTAPAIYSKGDPLHTPDQVAIRRGRLPPENAPSMIRPALAKHDLFRKPVPIPDRGRGHAFRDHAPTGPPRRNHASEKSSGAAEGHSTAPYSTRPGWGARGRPGPGR